MYSNLPISALLLTDECFKFNNSQAVAKYLCNYVVVALVTWSKLNLSSAASSSHLHYPAFLAGLSKVALMEIVRKAH
jgi:pyrrolidone-carboxylate peptidase